MSLIGNPISLEFRHIPSERKLFLAQMLLSPPHLAIHFK